MHCRSQGKNLSPWDWFLGSFHLGNPCYQPLRDKHSQKKISVDKDGCRRNPPVFSGWRQFHHQVAGSVEFIAFKFTAIIFGHTLGTYIKISADGITTESPNIFQLLTIASHSCTIAPHPPRHPINQQFWMKPLTISACWMWVSMHHPVDVEHVFVPPKSVHRTPERK